MSIDWWMDKEDVVHIYNGVLIIKNMKYCHLHSTWMDLEIIILSEVSQKEN